MCIYGVYGLFMDIYEHLCSNLQFISLPEEVGEFLLYIMLNLFNFQKVCITGTSIYHSSSKNKIIACFQGEYFLNF